MSVDRQKPLHRPRLLDKAHELNNYLKTLSASQLAAVMNLSPELAQNTHELIASWTTSGDLQSPAMDCFIGDIYSGLRAKDLSSADRAYADQKLIILSGLYGCLHPYDGIYPYRLEMAYRLPDPAYTNLYKFWGDSIARCIPAAGPIVNLASVEYSKMVTPYIDATRLIVPKFLTVDPKTNKPTFVVVHAKIARGAFARWLITSRTIDATKLTHFSEIGYRFSKELSTPAQPTFVCHTFDGKGLSMRLQ